MPDLPEIYAAGEERPLFVTLTAGVDPVSGVQGTLQIQAGGTVTLYDATGTPAGGIDGAFLTAYDPDPAASVRAWYDLNTAGITPGRYTLTFNVTALGSDGLTRLREPSVGVWIQAVPNATGLPDAGDVIALLASAKLPPPDTADVGQALAAAIQDISQQTNRIFASSPEQRRYSGMGQDYLEIDPCRDITALEQLDVTGTVVYTYPTTDYVAEPINATIKTGIRRAPWILYPPPHFAFGVGNIRVSATFGDAVTPDLYQAIVEQAALILAPPLIRLVTGGVMEWREGDAMVRYHPEILHQVIEQWQAHVKAVCGNRHRWAL